MNVTVVLLRPQHLVNIAVIMRAMGNFGVRELRLVEPAEYDPVRVEGIAHRAREIIARATIFAERDEALADFTHVIGLTARGRTVKRNVQRPPDAAAELLRLETRERAALLLGPEDHGLSNDDLDRCHRIVTIPTMEDHGSLNLAQAATVVLYELFKVASDAPSFKRPRREAPPADGRLLEMLFDDAERTLRAIEFFKSHTTESIMRTLREIVHRTPLDAREVALLRAMCLETVHFLERKGVRSS